MEISQAVATAPGVTAAIVAMATPLNLDLYERLGFDPQEIADATPNDLMIAVEAGAEDELAGALAVLDARLSAQDEHRRRPARTRRSRRGPCPPPCAPVPTSA